MNVVPGGTGSCDATMPIARSDTVLSFRVTLSVSLSDA